MRGDAFPADDAGVFAVRRSDPERVLFVHAAHDPRSAALLRSGAGCGSAIFICSPIRRRGTDHRSRSIQVRVRRAVRYRVAARRSSNTLLSNTSRRAAACLIALGTHAASPRANSNLGRHCHGCRTTTRASATAATIGQVDFTYPALEQAQPGRDNGGWAEGKIFYASAVDSGGARVAARLTDGTPLLLDKQVGEGHVLLLTSGLENLTNDLPLHPVFVAFVDHAARYLSGSERLSGSQARGFICQLRAATQPIGAAGNVEVIDPDGRGRCR